MDRYNFIEIFSQKELDEALKTASLDEHIRLSGDASFVIRVKRVYSSAITATSNCKVELFVPDFASFTIACVEQSKVWVHGRVRAIARDKAQVWADGNASVVAYDQSIVEARGDTSVAAHGCAQVTAYDQTAVRIKGTGSFFLFDEAHAMIECKSGSVKAYNKSIVKIGGPPAWGKNVELFDEAKVMPFETWA